MAFKSSSSAVQMASFLGYKKFTSDGYLELVNKQHHTIGYADMYKINPTSLSDLSSPTKSRIIQRFRLYLTNSPVQSEIISLPIINPDSFKPKRYWDTLHEALYQKIRLQKTLHHKDKDHQQALKQDKVRFTDTQHIINNLKTIDIMAAHMQYWLIVFSKSTKDLYNLYLSMAPLEISRPVSIKAKLACLYRLRFATNDANDLDKSKQNLTAKQANKVIAKDWHDPNVHLGYLKLSGFYGTFIEFSHYWPLQHHHIPAFWADNLMNCADVIGFFSFDDSKGLTPFTAFIPGFSNVQSLHRMNIKLFVYGVTPNDALKTALHLVKARNTDRLSLNTRMRALKPISLRQIIGHHNQKCALHSIFRPIKDQSRSTRNLITENHLARAYPCDFKERTDPQGEYFGVTSTTGQMCFDPFHHDREHPNSVSLISGRPGMGKSTLAKHLALDAFDRGYHVYCFDDTGEYCPLTITSGGTIINLSKGSYINPFQLYDIYPTSHASFPALDSLEEISANLKRITVFIGTLSPYMTDDDLKVTGNLLAKFYQQYVHVDWQKLPANKFPTMSEFYGFVKNYCVKIQSNVLATSNDIEGSNKLRYVLHHLIHKYGDVLDHHTKLPKISRSYMVDFDMDKLYEKNRHLAKAETLNAVALATARVQHARTIDQNTQSYFSFDSAWNLLRYTPRNHYLNYFCKFLNLWQRLHISATFVIFGINDLLPASKRSYESASHYHKLSGYRNLLIYFFKHLRYVHLFTSSDTDIRQFNDIMLSAWHNNIPGYFQGAQVPHRLITIEPTPDKNLSYLWSTELTEYQWKRFND